MAKSNSDRLTKVSKVLISQPRPMDEKSHYFEIAEKYDIKLDFTPFVEIQPVDIKEFRKQKIDILAHTAVIFTSRNAVDHFFKLCAESKIEMPAQTKYFCVTEQTANYLQKYIVLRKRKIFVGEKTAHDLIAILKKHKGEKIIFPCSNGNRGELVEFLQHNDYNYTEAIIYNTVPSDLSAISKLNYDIIAFFSPSALDSLLFNFPQFKQNKTRLAAFGAATAKAIRDAGFILDIEAPTPEAPSMTSALEFYVKKANK